MHYFSSYKLKILEWLADKGWSLHKKEFHSYKGKSIWVTKDGFNRKDEKDDVWLYMLARHHRAIVDVGCNIGQSSLLLTLGTTNEILCLDPNANALSKCSENLIYNNLSLRARFINAFVSNEDDLEQEFYTMGDDAAGSMYSSFAKTASNLRRNIKVKTLKLETVCSNLAFNPDLIKIDVEGAEELVLKGIGPFILKSEPDIFVEIHSGPQLSIIENTNSVLKWCDINHYIPYYLKTHNVLESPSEIQNRGRFHLLLIKTGKSYPSYLKNLDINETLTDLIQRI